MLYLQLCRALPLYETMNTNAESGESDHCHIDVSSGLAATAQAAAIPPCQKNVLVRTRSAAYVDASNAVARTQHRQLREPQAKDEVQPRMQPPQQGPRQMIAREGPQDTGTGLTIPDVPHSMFGEPPSRTQLDRLFNKEQRQVGEHSLAPTLLIHTFVHLNHCSQSFLPVPSERAAVQAQVEL